jgi:hypothetical protein
MLHWQFTLTSARSGKLPKYIVSRPNKLKWKQMLIIIIVFGTLWFIVENIFLPDYVGSF